ncbi:TonB-dependent receptor [Polyangium aurulentum]|uniref:TonB-dependent receptor n=1 Tax=Polyangium aurulentum TaxID=2567896 RepID=UPI001F32C2EA|nr:TonB-dependent receptor [Polyangium aurulentum]
MISPSKRFSLAAAWFVVPAVVLSEGSAHAQGAAVITGTVVDAATNRPVPDVVITATSPALQGEQIVVTDAGGNYRLPSLPPGEGYTVRAEMEKYRPVARGGISLRNGSTVRVNLELLPEAIQNEEEIVVVGRPPVIDVGSSRVGVTIDSDFTRRIAVNPPGGRGGATRSFESLAATAPGTFTDAYGVSVNGTTSPENGFIIDGMSASDGAFGTLATPLSSEFVKEVNVITAGYLPEYGRAIGGVMDVVTKGGSNEFHGSVFSSVTPGMFEGKRALLPRAGSTITTDPHLSSIHDFGFELGGPIVKDKLWFFTGLSVAMTRYRLDRNLNKLLFEENPDGTPRLDADGNPIPIVDADTGFQRSTRLPGTSRSDYTSGRTFQYIGKLTWNVSPDHNVSLSVFGVPSRSGGNGNYTSTGNIIGTYESLGGTSQGFTNNVVLKSSSSFMNKKLLFDATFGWMYGSDVSSAADGSDVFDNRTPGTLASIPSVSWQRASKPGPHSILEFEGLPPEARAMCAPGGGTSLAGIYCPVRDYATGGPGLLSSSTQNRYQGRGLFTVLASALGQHVIKAGLDIELLDYTNTKGYSGGHVLEETADGTRFKDSRYGFLQGPDDAVTLDRFSATSRSVTVGGFLQDSWNILDRVTVNVGLRYDTQVVIGNDGRVGLTLPNQWSPRLGAIWDPTREGRAKVFANFARFYQAISLNMADRAFPGELSLTSYHPAAACDPQILVRGARCNEGGLVTEGGATDANQKYTVVGSDRVPVDPDIEPQSSDQFVFGGEYEIVQNGRLGGAYTHQILNNAIEDMSRDEAQTYFIGNPGSGIASDFPKPARKYDSLMVYFQKNFADQWLAQASYTLSYLRGNLAGLYRPETGQLDPNINSDFDLQSLLPNREGPLPGDRTHSIKLYGAKEFALPGGAHLSLGASYTTRSGTPLNVLGAHPIYDRGEVFILPRGAGGRTPWVHNIDTNVTVGYQIAKDSRLTVGLDVFNLFNLQTATSFDQEFTRANVRPIPNGTTADLPTKTSAGKLVNFKDGSAFDPVAQNPNYGKPTAYQTPRQVRINMRVTF